MDTRPWDVAAPHSSLPCEHLLASSAPNSQGMLLHTGHASPDVTLTLLCPLQADCALWTVQLQRKLPWQKVRRAVSTEPPALEVDTTLHLCAGQRQGLCALLQPDAGCRQVRLPLRILVSGTSCPEAGKAGCGAGGIGLTARWCMRAQPCPDHSGPAARDVRDGAHRGCGPSAPGGRPHLLAASPH